MRLLCSLFLLLRPPLCSTLFPYTTLFRSVVALTHAHVELIAWTRGPFEGSIPEVEQCSIEEEPLMAQPRVSNPRTDRKSTRLNSSHVSISYAVFCLKKKKKNKKSTHQKYK